MSQSKAKLCSHILREFYGDVVEKVGIFLAKKGCMPLGVIIQDTKLKREQVKRALSVLIQHNLASFIQNKRGLVEYSIDIPRILLRPRFPRFIYTAKLLYGDTAELIAEEMVQHGQMTLNALVQRVTDRLNEAIQDQDKSPITPDEVWTKFTDLAETHFVQRLPEVENEDGPKPVPGFSLEESDLYRVPPMEVDVVSRKRKASGEHPDGPSSKRTKQDGEQSSSDQINAPKGSYWRINYDRFNHYLRDQCIISAVANKFDQKAAEIIRTILRISEVKSDPMAVVTTPISSHDIFQALPKENELKKPEVDQYLNLLSEDSMDFVVRAGDSGGGMYSIHVKKALKALATAHIESVVQERFGSKCLRIFKLLLQKKQLEQKQIEEFAMIPAKEAKEMLYRMFGENFIFLTEVPKAPDHAPARTIYLFSVIIEPIARMLLGQCYKAATNLLLRREYEAKESKRLLDKQQRVEAIAASLEQSGAEQGQREEIEDMISPPERAQLAKVKHMTNKLEQGELQLDETTFIFDMYLQYASLT